MKRVVCILLFCGLAAPALRAQATGANAPGINAPDVNAPEFKDATSPPVAPQTGQTQEQRGSQLIDQMVRALGGQAWRDRRDMQFNGRVATFYQGQPNGNIVEFDASHQFPNPTHPEAERIGFLTDKSMIFPGKKIDVVQIWTGGNGYEVTYKGKTTLPKDQVEDYYRRKAHSIEDVVRIWIKAPGVMIVYDGTAMVERRMADKVTVLGANNDAVIIDLDAQTHLPLRRTFEWRNTTFKDHDEDIEEYDDYHTVQGVPTAFTITRYRNGDMTSQRFFTRVQYNTGLPPALFNPDNLLKKK